MKQNLIKDSKRKQSRIVKKTAKKAVKKDVASFLPFPETVPEYQKEMANVILDFGRYCLKIDTKKPKLLEMEMWKTVFKIRDVWAKYMTDEEKTVRNGFKAVERAAAREQRKILKDRQAIMNVSRQKVVAGIKKLPWWKRLFNQF